MSHRPAAAAVIEAVATRAGVDETELPPLYDAVDPDALDNLVARWAGGSPQSAGHVRFQYYGYTVLVHFDDRLVIEIE